MEQWRSKTEEIVDSHVHMAGLDTEQSLLSIRKAAGIDKMALVAIQDPEAGSGLAAAVYMKSCHPGGFFVFAGLNHAGQLSGGEVPGQTLTEQVEANVKMGCDGIKMIEGKPTSRQRVDIPVTDDYFREYWAQVEELKLPVVWHVNDPEEFWDPNRIPKWAKERGWGYSPDDVQKEELYGEVEEILQRHPQLRVTFAHFYFLSADLPRASCFLDKHPTVRFDLAPGIEMLYNISEDPETGRDFFINYADRIVFGTDIASDVTVEKGRIRAGMMFRWLESDDTFRSPEQADFLLGPPEDGIIRGLHLPPEVLDKIYRENFVERAGERPCPLDIGAAVEQLERTARIAEDLSGHRKEETEAARVAKRLSEQR